MPTTGGSPNGNLSTAISEVIRNDRQTDDLVIVDQEVSGTINYELSFDPYAPLIEALLQNVASTFDDTATDIGIAVAGDVATITSASVADFSTLVVGQHVLVSGFTTNAGNNTVMRVLTSAAGNFTAQLLVGHTAVTESSGDTIRVTANSFRNGVATPKSYTILKRVEGLASDVFMYYRGCQIGGMTFNYESGSILNGSFDVVGLTEDVTLSALSGQAFTDVPAYTLMNAVSSLTADIEGITAEFENVNITINNNINAAKAVGTLGAVALASFTFEVTADISIYFEDEAVYNKYKTSQAFGATLSTIDGDGNYIVIYLPKCKFESLESPIPGKDNFYMLSGSFRALRDASTNMTAQVSLLAKHV
ncbi:MAG: hypothetical protein DRQ45_00070 [Gammaproteobacteria bacterium]|nr:MAG: hypothetical protein DRQ45_00070 [Gammaproteobacteria bacterium]